ncbi:RNA-binding protein 7 [Liparis tanakae]|uniref:RNA-binding protein 7 n=1 Tax=Liparis tanakae TaxID=230148 RepID=A0A4Z2J297_9TELE|nr:RNA-binding protein 7 [Liparis tanakae]
MAGPLIKTKIPKDPDGKQKTFGFAVYKNEVSVPYAMQLIDGTSLTPTQFSSPPPTPMQRSFSSPDNLQKHVMMNNMMWLHMPQLEQVNDGFSKPLQRQPPTGGSCGGGGSRQHDGAPYRQSNSGARNQRYPEEPAPGRQGRDSYHHQNDSYYHQNDRSGNRHRGNRAGNKHHDDKGSNRDHQDNRWRRY